MRYRPRAVRAILDEQADHLNGLLAAVPDDVDLWSATDEDMAAATSLWRVLRSGGPLSGVGPTTTSKLMARKRPRLIPIVDSVVRDALEFEQDSWTELRAALQQVDLPERIEELRPARCRRGRLYPPAPRCCRLDAVQPGKGCPRCSDCSRPGNAQRLSRGDQPGGPRLPRLRSLSLPNLHQPPPALPTGRCIGGQPPLSRRK